MVVWVVCGSGLPACVGDVGDPGESEGATRVTGALLAPPRVGFERVADALAPSCGTLDCHGQIGRNLRLYGGRGLRLDPKGNPADGQTTFEEYNATYWSVVALEPELLSDVVAAHGARPERLSLIRKGRGTERHKGGSLMVVGDQLDRCLISWLAEAVDQTVCKAAAKASDPRANEREP